MKKLIIILSFLLCYAFQSIGQDKYDFVMGVGGTAAKTTGYWSNSQPFGVGAYGEANVMVLQFLSAGIEYKYTSFIGESNYTNITIHTTTIKGAYYFGKCFTGRYYANIGISMNMGPDPAIGVVPGIGVLIPINKTLAFNSCINYNINDDYGHATLYAGISFILPAPKK